MLSKSQENRLTMLLEKANRLPKSPGVYLMKNARGDIIYIGKSRALKNRVSQYFQRIADHTEKTRRMVLAVHDFSYILTDTEMEALTLENSLIKHHAPKYNIRLKDDKNYPYIRISEDAFPTITMVRRRSADHARYYGPFSSAQTVWKLIGALQKIFGLARCKLRLNEGQTKTRACIYKQMGSCTAPCDGSIESQDYRQLFSQIHTLLHGNSTQLKRELESQMTEASEQLDFEHAAQLRDRLQLIGRIWEKQKVVGAPGTEQDVFAYVTTETYTCVTVFYVRDGMLLDTEHQIFGAEQLFDEESAEQFLVSFYQSRQYIPHTILLDFTLSSDAEQTVRDCLEQMEQRHIRLYTPKRGELRALCEMARQNAEEYGKEYQSRSERDNRTLVRLASLLHLEVLPQRIESFDISNYGEEHVTAGMVVMTDGNFSKKEYRTFSIRTVTQDDYGAMQEVLRRRFTHFAQGDKGFDIPPDLLLLDGGVGHVHAAMQVLEEFNLDIPVFGMVKDAYHKTRTLTDGRKEINIAHEQQVFVLLYRLQEEVHRYTVSRMQQAKRRTITHSSLEHISGIGPQKAKALLTHFKGLAGVKEASIEQLCNVKGITPVLAQRIYQEYHDAPVDQNRTEARR